jgi:hypothetical protein
VVLRAANSPHRSQGCSLGAQALGKRTNTHTTHEAQHRGEGRAAALPPAAEFQSAGRHQTMHTDKHPQVAHSRGHAMCAHPVRGATAGSTGNSTAHQTGSARPLKHRPQSSWSPGSSLEGCTPTHCPNRHTSPSPLTPTRHTLHTRTPQHAVADCSHAQLPPNPLPEGAQAQPHRQQQDTLCSTSKAPRPAWTPHHICCMRALLRKETQA